MRVYRYLFKILNKAMGLRNERLGGFNYGGWRLWGVLGA